MDITDKASKLILTALKNNNCTGVRIYSTTSCCGTSLGLDLINIEDEQPVMFNEVPVVMDAQTKQSTVGVILDEENGNLVLRYEGGCGCGCGCN